MGKPDACKYRLRRTIEIIRLSCGPISSFGARDFEPVAQGGARARIDENTFPKAGVIRHAGRARSVDLGPSPLTPSSVKKRILVLGAGFGGLELSTILAETFGDAVEVTLIDRGDSFHFGFSKLDVMFGLTSPESVRLPYARFLKPGVRFRRETISAVDPVAKRVTTDRGTHEADFLVVALGADYDFAATPGMADASEFYSLAGATKLAGLVKTFAKGRVLISVASAPYKCPPAPSEAALMMHDHLTARGVRSACEIIITNPLPSPVPPSPETSRALLAAFAERGITFLGKTGLKAVDVGRQVAVLADGREMAYDLFLGVPAIRAPRMLESSGLLDGGFVHVNPKSLETRFPEVYAIGDCAKQGTPKAGVFAEGAARAVAASISARLRDHEVPVTHRGTGTCYIEYGGGRIGRVDIDFSDPEKPTGVYHEPSVALRADKDHFGASRRARWFGL